MRLPLPFACSVFLSVLLACPVIQAQEQPSPVSAQVNAAVPDITKAILAATGYASDSVEVTAGPYQLIVTLVNSKLAKGPAAARKAEAGRIVQAIVKVISGKPELLNIQALHVDYITRHADGSDPDAVDAIDFRKNAQGAFVHHMT